MIFQKEGAEIEMIDWCRSAGDLWHAARQCDTGRSGGRIRAAGLQAAQHRA
jgi:hypothetical protein